MPDLLYPLNPSLVKALDQTWVSSERKLSQKNAKIFVRKSQTFSRNKCENDTKYLDNCFAKKIREKHSCINLWNYICSESSALEVLLYHN